MPISFSHLLPDTRRSDGNLLGKKRSFGCKISRTAVYLFLCSHLQKMADLPSPCDLLGRLPPEMMEHGLENAPEEVQRMYQELIDAGELCSYLRRLSQAFNPDSLEMRPGAEWILSYYPAGHKCFDSVEALRQDDENRVSSVIADGNAEIEQIVHSLSDKLKVAWVDLDEVARSVVINGVETLGVQWGICEARSTAVVDWFESKWGVGWV
ncbi:hypothetical protein HOY80DRAFT_642166 [Tuber brumale]|nr:hypothetical protein HOY80DRAFT_642166 [Tuber brumale]